MAVDCSAYTIRYLNLPYCFLSDSVLQYKEKDLHTCILVLITFSLQSRNHLESSITIAPFTVGDELLHQKIKAPSSKWSKFSFGARGAVIPLQLTRGRSRIFMRSSFIRRAGGMKARDENLALRRRLDASRSWVPASAEAETSRIQEQLEVARVKLRPQQVGNTLEHRAPTRPTSALIPVFL